jgi:hypothetical protein
MENAGKTPFMPLKTRDSEVFSVFQRPAAVVQAISEQGCGWHALLHSLGRNGGT